MFREWQRSIFLCLPGRWSNYQARGSYSCSSSTPPSPLLIPPEIPFFILIIRQTYFPGVLQPHEGMMQLPKTWVPLPCTYMASPSLLLAQKEQVSVFSTGFWDEKRCPRAQAELGAAVIWPLRGTLTLMRCWTWTLQLLNFSVSPIHDGFILLISPWTAFVGQPHPHPWPLLLIQLGRTMRCVCLWLCPHFQMDSGHETWCLLSTHTIRPARHGHIWSWGETWWTEVLSPQSVANSLRLKECLWVPAQLSSLQIALQVQMQQLFVADLRVCHTDGGQVWSSEQDANTSLSSLQAQRGLQMLGQKTCH